MYKLSQKEDGINCSFTHCQQRVDIVGLCLHGAESNVGVLSDTVVIVTLCASATVVVNPLLLFRCTDHFKDGHELRVAKVHVAHAVPVREYRRVRSHRPCNKCPELLPHLFHMPYTRLTMK